MTKHLFASTLLAITFLIACSPKNTVPSVEKEPEAYTGPMVSYSKDIVPVFERSCAPCHYPDKGGRKEALDNYENVKSEIGDIIRRVELPVDHEDYMPFKEKREALSETEVEMLKNWARGGFNE